MGRAQAEQLKNPGETGVLRFKPACGWCSSRKVRGCIKCSAPVCAKHGRIRNHKLYCPDCAPTLCISGDQFFELTNDIDERFELTR